MARGRPPSDATKLGRYLRAHGIQVYELGAGAGMNSRTLTEYLAGRRYIRPDHAIAFAKFLNCEVEDIVDEDITEDITTVSGIPLNGAAGVKDLPRRRPNIAEPTAPLPVPKIPAPTFPQPVRGTM